MSEVTVASKAIEIYLEISKRKEEAEAALDAVKEQLKIAESAVIEQMNSLAEAAGVPLEGFKLGVGGYNWSVKQKTYYNVPAAHKEELFSLLESYGYEDIITRQVNREKLSTAMTAIQQDNGEELPPEFEDIEMKSYTEMKIGHIKTGRGKAGKE